MPTAVAQTSKSKKTYQDIHVLSTDPNEETFVARIFDEKEPFTFSTDVNSFLKFAAFGNEPGAIGEFLLSLLHVDVAEDDDDTAVSTKRYEIKRRFETILKGTRKMTDERLIRFVIDLTEIAGNEATT